MSKSAETDLELKLVNRIADFHYDPYKFCLYAYPWGEGPLKNHTGPREWQKKDLLWIGDQLTKQKKEKNQIIQMARCSGHGIGKTALISMVVGWAMSTSLDCHGIITAGTQPQLKNKIIPEIFKWHRMAINSHWFEMTATSMFSKDPQHALTWRTDITPWNKNRPEAFAGLHNEGKRLIIVYDEASQIDQSIWETTMGALTDENTEIIWLVFGNGTRNTGAFRECFGKQKSTWNGLCIDARQVEGTNKQYFKDLAEAYGEDSDLFRVRVKGEFPKAGDLQFIPNDWVEAAQHRKPDWSKNDPVVVGFDVSRGGSDFCVARLRRGMDAKTIKPLRIPGADARDSMKVVGILIDWMKRAEVTLGGDRIDAIFVDKTGVGGPLADRLRTLHFPAIDIGFGDASPDRSCARLSDWMWMKMREAVRVGLAIEEDADLEQDLTNRQYTMNDKDQWVLERKDDMKERGLSSPDDGDALALTFAMPIAPNGNLVYGGRKIEMANTQDGKWNILDRAKRGR